MFTISHVNCADRELVGRVKNFLEDNYDKNIRPRPNEELDRAFKSGLGLVVQSAAEHKIVGCSLIYGFQDGSTAQDYLEIGTMRIVENGFGLQRWLASFHILQELVENIDKPRQLFAVVSHGTASEHVLEGQVGLIEKSPSKDLMMARKKVGVPFLEGKKVLFSTPEIFGNSVKFLVGLHKSERLFLTPKGGKDISISIPWFTGAALDILSKQW